MIQKMIPAEVCQRLKIDFTIINTDVHSVMTSTESLVVLNMLESIGPVTVRRLLDEFVDPWKILQTSMASLMKVPGIGEELAHTISTWEQKIDLAEELARCEAFGCQIITGLDSHYPTQLSQIYDPPIVLYVKGSLTTSDHSGIAIVGARRSTHYGRETARRLAHQLAATGVCIVSGGARGIDSAAHTGALQARGRTLCVLGNGINLVYPPENRDLFDRIAQNGAVITQFPFNRQADRQTFPIRNRIVAGMCLGTVVIEANTKSGALITANMANDYGRQVFAIPGPIHSPQSKGCHQLIKNGAKLCESQEDILSEFEYLFPGLNHPNKATSVALNQAENDLLDLLEAQESHIDDITRRSGLSVAAVSVTLLQLEMKGFIAQQPGHIYSTTGKR